MDRELIDRFQIIDTDYDFEEEVLFWRRSPNGGNRLVCERRRIERERAVNDQPTASTSSEEFSANNDLNDAETNGGKMKRLNR